MTQWLKQSTAYTFQMGPFVDSTDGVTPEASLTIAATDVDVSKNGGAFDNKNDSTAMTGTGDSQGWYDCVLDTTDTGTLGKLDVRCYVSGALPVWKSFMVLPANVYDSFVSGSAYLAADVVAISGDTTAADNLEKATDGTGYNVGNGSIVAASVSGAVGSVTGDVGNVTGSVGSVTGNVGGNVAGSVGSVAAGGIAAASFAAGAINAAAIATGAIDADALAADAVDEILDEVVEGSYTVRQYLRLFAAALTGLTSGGGTATLVFRDTGDSKNRITATVDASKNRTAMTLDAS